MGRERCQVMGDMNLAFLGSLGRNPSWCWWLQGKVLVGEKGFVGAQMLSGGCCGPALVGKKKISGGLHTAGGEVLGCPMLTPCHSPAVVPAVQPDHRGGSHDAAAEGALHGGGAGASAEGQPPPGPDPSPPRVGGLHQQLRFSHPQPLRGGRGERTDTPSCQPGLWR